MMDISLQSTNIKQEWSRRVVVLGLVVVFVATHGWALLSWNALYWDDWSILTSDSAELHRMFKFVGFELTGYLHAWLVPMGAGAYKILMLFSLAVMSACVFLIARNYAMTVKQAGLITALFIVAPLNTSKIAAVNVAALMFAAIFFLAWVVLLWDLQKPSLLKRLGALTLFSVAFYLPSSLAFFALPAMSIAWHTYCSSGSWSHRFAALFKRLDFLALPFIQFAIFRLYFFRPDTSIANEYQQFGIRTSRLQEALDRIQADVVLDMPWVVRILLLALPVLILLRFAKRPSVQENKFASRIDLWMCIGLSACVFALLPYLAVGRLPVFSDWNSRYHLFLPLGYALICWSMGQYIAFFAQSKWMGVATYALILALSAGFSVRSYFEYADDWRKQNQLINALKEQKDIRQSDNIVIVDTVSYAKRREVRYNEYTQMMLRAQPGWSGLALSYKQLQKVGGGSLMQYVMSLGRIENIQSDPKLYGLPSGWRWSSSCVVFVIIEVDGLVQIEQGRGKKLVQSPCVFKSTDSF